jgi:hypothetical protein
MEPKFWKITGSVVSFVSFGIWPQFGDAVDRTRLAACICDHLINAYLGGNDNYPADRAAVRQILRDFPEVRAIALANREFMQRAVRFLAAEAGIRQFIDIGTGIPSAGNVHEVAGGPRLTRGSCTWTTTRSSTSMRKRC